MHPSLEPYYHQLEQQRQEFSAWVANSPTDKQEQSLGPGQWSAAQVLYHLAQVDQLVVGSLAKRIASEKPLRAYGWGTRFRGFLLNLFLKLPIKFKAPAAVQEVPDQVVVPQVIQQWQETREQLHRFLTAYQPEYLDKEVFFHPRSGMITLPQTLRFMVEHTEHHRRQMRRLLS
ncbi:DinB family protein [Rufibacter radiotolerans]|uniref:DinB family protein n=1 Tax=Rufibacter radiotolerans TaxID=1379910 RepID=UPI0006647C34|nr:DinB family protein [Rufibacter radiotolerans]